MTQIDLTSEYFKSTGLTIHQPARGHRYGGESLALARFCDIRPGDAVVEFGSGVGVISLIVAALNKPGKIAAVEIQLKLHEIAMRNVHENCMYDIVECINDDYRSFAENNHGRFDVVMANPPFYAVGEGRISKDPERAMARHELGGTLCDLISSSRKILKASGILAIVFLKGREGELLNAASGAGFQLKRRDDRLCDIFLAEFVLEGQPLDR